MCGYAYYIVEQIKHTDTMNELIHNPIEIDNYVPQKVNFDIFISYRRADGREYARNIQLGLQQRGSTFNVFFDYESVRAGKFNLQILDAIYSSSIFILVITPLVFENCLKENDWIMREVRTALKYNKKIIPCVIDDAESGIIWKGWPDNLPDDVKCITDEQAFRLKVDSYFKYSIKELMDVCQETIRQQNLALISAFNSRNKEQAGTSSCESFNVRGVTFNMIYVEGGAFLMGATEEQDGVATNKEYPVHPVTLSSYYIGQTQVTQALWESVMGTNPSVNRGNGQQPVENITWYDCQDFISKLNDLTGREFRLPTEAEWEYAARGGKFSHAYKYAGSDNTDEVAWHDTNSNDCSQPVASKMPNELGLYDMSGNVWEWCNDYFGTYPSEPQINPQGPETGNKKVMRGGSYFSSVDYGRVSNRFAPPSLLFKAHPLGIRLALTV